MSGLDGVHLLRQACPIAGMVLESASVAPDAIHEARVRVPTTFYPNPWRTPRSSQRVWSRTRWWSAARTSPCAASLPLKTPRPQAARKLIGCRALMGLSGCSQGYVVLYGGTPDSMIYAVGIIITDFRLRHEETAKKVLQALRAYLGVHVPAIILMGDTSPQRLRDAQFTAALPMHKPASIHQLRDAMVQLIAHPPASAQDERARQSDAAITTSAATIP